MLQYRFAGHRFARGLGLGLCLRRGLGLRLGLKLRLALGFTLAGSLCHGADRAADAEPFAPTFDYHSYANIDQFQATHLELDVRVDMENKQIIGVAALKFRRLDPRATQIVLDTKDLTINDVSVKANDVLGATGKSETIWVSRPFHMEKPDPILGSALVIELPPSKRPTESIRIDYVNTPESSALIWLSDKQTAKHKAFLYTQAEPLGARSWIPLQDTPQVRMTYKAGVHTDDGVTALMSAENDPKAKQKGEFSFVMPQPVPSYLIALAVGDVQYRELGPRTGVYAEKSELGNAAKEFAGMESILTAAEKSFGPYRWGRYDILVMPPGYAIAGMENPRLAFISSTDVPGDASMVYKTTRQLAAAWSGNLVGNATWRDLWLNEGFTEYVQGRIVENVYGEPRASLDATFGLTSLRADLAGLKPADQLLAIDLGDRDPKEMFTQVPGQKGRLFFSYLEARFGREHFDSFLRGYADQFAFKGISTEQFLSYLKANLLDRYPGIVTAEQVKAWVSGSGIPADAPLPLTALLEPVDAARTAWLAGTLETKKYKPGWVPEQWLYFLEHMPDGLRAAQLSDLDKAYGFTRTPNAEIAQRWYTLVIAAAYQPAFAGLEDYLHSVGRESLILPLYTALMKTPSGSEFAKRVFAKARPLYLAPTAAAIEAIVTPKVEPDD